MFQLTVDRLVPMFPVERILVVTVESQIGLLQAQAPTLSSTNFVIEPSPKGTASVIGLAAVLLNARDAEAIMVCLPADHFIANLERFHLSLRAAISLAREGDLVTLGVGPSYPSTGYGYIRIGDLRGVYEGIEAFQVGSFEEKPVQEVAEAYFASGDYFWNSGVFIWRTARILEEIQRLMPDLSARLKEIAEALGRPDEQAVAQKVWADLTPQTIDYGVMEKAARVSMIPADELGWWDVGGWDRLFEVLGPDEHGNLILAQETLPVDTRGTLVYQDPESSERRLIATLGVEDLIVVDTGDVVLVCSRERAEDVRKLVKILSERGRPEFL